MNYLSTEFPAHTISVLHLQTKKQLLQTDQEPVADWVMTVIPAKMDEPIEVSFWVWSVDSWVDGTIY